MTGKGLCGRFQLVPEHPKTCDKGESCQYDQFAVGPKDAKTISDSLAFRAAARQQRAEENKAQASADAPLGGKGQAPVGGKPN